MIDFQSAVQQAMFTRSTAPPQSQPRRRVAERARGRRARPEAKGLVIIGLVALDAPEDKDGGFEKATVPVFTYMRKPDATELYALNSAVRNALEGQPISAPAPRSRRRPSSAPTPI
jgi:hypothetical protein